MKKEVWKTILQVIIAVLTAVGTTLGVTSCKMCIRDRDGRGAADGVELVAHAGAYHREDRDCLLYTSRCV